MRPILLALSAALLLAPAGLAQNNGTRSYAEDRAEIENISNRYMIAVDVGDIDTVMATWADDGVLEWVGGVENGKDAIRQAMSHFGGAALKGKVPADATSRPRTQHQIINHVIDVDGDHAHSVAYWFALTNNTPDGTPKVLYFGHYEDQLVKKGGHWLFTKRSVYNENQKNKALFYPGLGESDPRAK
jgi:hypothetical protein